MLGSRQVTPKSLTHHDYWRSSEVSEAPNLSSPEIDTKNEHINDFISVMEKHKQEGKHMKRGSMPSRARQPELRPPGDPLRNLAERAVELPYGRQVRLGIPSSLSLESGLAGCEFAAI